MDKNLRRKVSLVALTVVFALFCWLEAPVGYAASGLKHKPVPKQRPGGANQVEGLNGKIGQTLFDGHWYFTVLSGPQPTDRYVERHNGANQFEGGPGGHTNTDTSTYIFTPWIGNKLFTIDCLLKNGQGTPKQLNLSGGPTFHTALTDDQGEAFQPLGYDMDGPRGDLSPNLAPGQSEPVTVIFAAPPNTNFQDLVFTLQTNGDGNTHDARVSLGTTGHFSSGPSALLALGPQVSGLSGKVGDLFFDGHWRFEVLSKPKDQGGSYELMYPSAAQNNLGDAPASFDPTILPPTFHAKDGYTLITVDCIFKNGQKDMRQLSPGPQNNVPLVTLKDNQGNTYPAVGFDMATTDQPWNSRFLLPGSAQRLIVIFSVPVGTKPKEMAFGLLNNGQQASEAHYVHVAFSD
jgi:hypothetical protein